MKTKLFSLLSLSILSLVLLASFASALTIDSVTTSNVPPEINHYDGSFTFNLLVNTSGTSNDDITLTVSGKTGTYTLSPLAMSDVSPGENRTITVTATFDKYQSNNLAGTITATTSSDTTGKLAHFSTSIRDSKTLSFLSSQTIPSGENYTNITLKNTGNQLISSIQLIPTEGFAVELTGGSNFNDGDDIVYTLSPGQEENITVTRTKALTSVGTQKVIITASATGVTSVTGTVYQEVEFYTGDNYGELDVSDINLDSKKGFGDDDEWYPGDDVEITFNVDNRGEYDISNIEIQACVYDTDANKCVFDEDDMDIDKDKFDLDRGDDRDVKLNFHVDPDNLKDGDSDYIIYIKAVGKIDDKDAKDDSRGDINGDKTGASDSESLSIVTDDNFAILDNFKLNSEELEDMELMNSVSCGSELQVSADVWNIGDEDQDDVKVRVYNQELGINKVIDIGDIDSYDSEKLEAIFNIPKNVEAKYYTIEFTIYDEDNDVFENDNDDKATFKVLIKVDGNCEVTSDVAKIAAVLTSQAKAGNELTVKATITNTATKTMTYVINVADYSDWATLKESTESNTMTLVAGESRDITLTFDVSKDASGDKKFNIEAISGDVVTKQPVALTIQAQKNFFGITLPQNNLYLWIIGAVNIILILAIIFVAIRLSRRD